MEETETNRSAHRARSDVEAKRMQCAGLSMTRVERLSDSPGPQTRDTQHAITGSHAEGADAAASVFLGRAEAAGGQPPCQPILINTEERKSKGLSS